MRKHLKKEPFCRDLHYSNKLYLKVLKILFVFFGKIQKEFSLVQHAKVLQYLQSTTKTKSIRNICVLSGRTRGVYRCVKLSRMNFRLYAKNGYISGFYKASW